MNNNTLTKIQDNLEVIWEELEIDVWETSPMEVQEIVSVAIDDLKSAIIELEELKEGDNK